MGEECVIMVWKVQEERVFRGMCVGGRGGGGGGWGVRRGKVSWRAIRMGVMTAGSVLTYRSWGG